MTEDSMRETLAQASGRYSDEEWAALVDSGDPLDQCTVTNARAVVANILEALARTPTATPSDGGWQPIETAPKDETDILLFIPDMQNYPDNPRIISAYWGTLGWTDNGAVGCQTWGTPTHWMPLSEPPSAIEGEKK